MASPVAIGTARKGSACRAARGFAALARTLAGTSQRPSKADKEPERKRRRESAIRSGVSSSRPSPGSHAAESESGDGGGIFDRMARQTLAEEPLEFA